MSVSNVLLSRNKNLFFKKELGLNLSKISDSLNRIGGEWQIGSIEKGHRSPDWLPATTKYWFRNSLGVLREILPNPRVAKHCKWAPERLETIDGKRVYGDVYTADWWWKKQVCFSLI
jgi:hypothetical protein